MKDAKKESRPGDINDSDNPSMTKRGHATDDPSTAPEEGTEHGKSASVKFAENNKVDESGAAVD